MARSTNQMPREIQKIIQRRWDRKQGRDTAILYRRLLANQNSADEPPILPFRPGREQGHIWVPMVRISVA